jgi:hypothetical protein
MIPRVCPRPLPGPRCSIPAGDFIGYSPLFFLASVTLWWNKNAQQFRYIDVAMTPTIRAVAISSRLSVWTGQPAALAGNSSGRGAEGGIALEGRGWVR